MAIAFDTYVLGLNVGQINGATWSHTVTGSDPYLFVVTYKNDAATSVDGVTYNGSAMTLLETRARSNYAPQIMYLWGMANPPTGAHNVVVTTTGSDSASSAYSWSYTGVDSIEADNSNAGNGGTNTVSVTTTDADAVLVGTATNFGDSTITASTNFTNVRDQSAYRLMIGDSIGTSLSPGSNVFNTSTSGVWAILVASVKPKAAPTFTATPLMHLMAQSGGLM